MPRDGILRDPISVMVSISGPHRPEKFGQDHAPCPPRLVMAGLDPAIPVLRAAAPEDVDPRDKPGDDEQTRFVAHPVNSVPRSGKSTALHDRAFAVFTGRGNL